MGFRKIGILFLFIGTFIAGCDLIRGAANGNAPAPLVVTGTATQLSPTPGITSTAQVSTTPTMEITLTNSKPAGQTGQPSLTPTATQAASPTPTPTQVSQPTPTESPTVKPTPTPNTSGEGQPNQPTPTPEPNNASQPTPTPANVSSGKQCLDKAGFFGDVTVPDDSMFRQGDQFTKTWRFRNEGTCQWGPTYSLVLVEGDQMRGPASVPLPNVPPGGVFDVSTNLTAPAQGGTYMGVYEFQDENGTRFGVNTDGIDKFWVKINVSWVAPTPAGGQPAGSGAPALSTSTFCVGAQENTDYENQIVAMVNQERVNQKKKPLTVNPALTKAAALHSADMACNNSLSHTGSDGSLWPARITAQGYKAAYTEENIYAGDPKYGGDPAGAFDWWMHSQVHKDNILSDNVTEIGVGYVYLEGSSYGGYYTIDFARPK